MKWKISNNENDWRNVRTKVFVEEQGFTLEFDDIDHYAIHITGYENDQLIGCARCFPDGDNVYRIGRIAVFKPYRKAGYGAKLLQKAEMVAKDQQAHFCILDAQCRAQGFYEKCGYEVCGEEHMDEHVPHIEMRKRLK